MTQITVEALRGFDHDGSRRRGQRFGVSTRTAEGLRARGLVRILEQHMPGNPSSAAGEKPSASPAAPASQPTTAKRSGRGAKKQTPAPAPVPSSSPTPPSAPALGPTPSTLSTEPGGTLI